MPRLALILVRSLCNVVTRFAYIEDISNSFLSGKFIAESGGVGVPKNVSVFYAPENIEDRLSLAYFSNLILTEGAFGKNVQEKLTVRCRSELCEFCRSLGSIPVKRFTRLDANRSIPSAHIKSRGLTNIFDCKDRCCPASYLQLTSPSSRYAHICSEFQSGRFSSVLNGSFGSLRASIRGPSGQQCKDNYRQQTQDLGDSDPELALGPIRLLLSRFRHGFLGLKIVFFSLLDFLTTGIAGWFGGQLDLNGRGRRRLGGFGLLLSGGFGCFFCGAGIFLAVPWLCSSAAGGSSISS